MRYTNANDTVTHVGTGNPLQQDNLPVRSTIPAADFNMIIWSLMAVVEAGGGVATNFDANTPASYQVLRNSLFKLIYPVNSIVHRYDTTDPGTLYPGTTWTRIAEGRVLVGLDVGGGADPDFNAIGDTGGAKEVTLTVDQIPGHVHTVNIYEPDDGAGGAVAADDGTDPSGTANTNSTGGGDPHENMPPYLVVSIWRRTA